MIGVDAVSIVYKANGTRWLADDTPIPIAEHLAELRHIGIGKIYAQATVLGPVASSRVPGAPTGLVNVFAISATDWRQIVASYKATLGFREWRGASYPKELVASVESDSIRVIGSSDVSSVAGGPVAIRELLGRPCRVYIQGDGLDDKSVPERVNIEIDSTGRISDVWLG